MDDLHADVAFFPGREKPTPDEPRKPFAFYLDESAAKKLRDIAIEQEEAVSLILRRIVTNYVNARWEGK